MARYRYPVELHKRAYELWESGYTLSEISRMPGMPDRRTLRAWSKPTFPCSCGYHGWAALRMAKLSLSEEGENAGSSGCEEPPSPAPVACEEVQVPESVWQKLSKLYGRRISPELSGDIESDMVATAYLILARVREILPKLAIHDVYQAATLLRIGEGILSAFKPTLSVEEEREIQVFLPKFHREADWSATEAEEEEEA